MSSGTKRGLLRELNRVIDENNTACVDGTTSSYRTRALRKRILKQSFETLWEDGYKIESVDSLGGKHVEHLAKKWESQGKAPSTIQNRLSVLRTFSHWIDKPGMVKESKDCVEDPDSVTRSTIAQEDHSWSSRGVDPDERIEQVQEDDHRTGVQLKLMKAFGLRQEEAAKLKPHLADQDTHLAVNWGTKGGRDRTAPIKSDYQREVLEEAKELAEPGESIIPPDKDYSQWRNRFYYRCRKHDIHSKGDGITPHGLRHEFLNDVYEEITGEPTPVRGGDPDAVDDDLEKVARQTVAELAGHSRIDISSAYIGSEG